MLKYLGIILTNRNKVHDDISRTVILEVFVTVLFSFKTIVIASTYQDGQDWDVQNSSCTIHVCI